MNAKKLGFGLMRLPLTNPTDEASVDTEALKKMVDVFMERGFTYFDTAPVYHGGQSEGCLKEVLIDRYPRDSFTLTTKLSPFVLRTKADVAALFDTQLRRTGAGYFDYYWLHNVNPNTVGTFDRLDAWDFLREKKEQGLIRHIGFSFHGAPEMLDEQLAKHPEIEYVQLQINYLDWDSISIRSRECYEVAVRHGKPVIVMEPVKGGTLSKVPAELEAAFKKREPGMSISSWAIRFAASLDKVVMVLSGMSTLEQVLDNTGYMQDFRPLNKEELAFIAKAAEIINRDLPIGCTGCSYCTETCPKHIAIPKYFSLYNAEQQEKDVAGWRPQANYYFNLTADYGKASDCLKCGLCERQCPQQLPIRSYLELVAEEFEHAF